MSRPDEAEGKDIYDVVERHLDMDPNLVLLILDEDFLLNKKRAMAFRDCVIKADSGVKFPSRNSPPSPQPFSPREREHVLK